jgi:hypothetical protein
LHFLHFLVNSVFDVFAFHGEMVQHVFFVFSADDVNESFRGVNKINFDLLLLLFDILQLHFGTFNRDFLKDELFMVLCILPEQYIDLYFHADLQSLIN